MPEIHRTPEDRFADLPDYPYPPRYTEVTADDGVALRLARIDEGPADGQVVVLLHGEPTWGLLWRAVLPPLLDTGHRVVVPDQVGFGRSDKPPRDWFTYERLYDTFTQHLAAAVPEGPVTLVVHDWGGPVGLRWAAEHPDRVAGLVVMDTGLYRSGSRMSEAWHRLRDYIEQADELPVGSLVSGGCLRDLTDAEVAAYEAPFPGPAYQGGALALPLLVPTSDDFPGAAEQIAAFDRLESWQDTPVLVLWGEHDPILPPGVGERIAELIPSAGPVETVPGAHFLQEDAGPQIGVRIAGFVERLTG